MAEHDRSGPAAERGWEPAGTVTAHGVAIPVPETLLVAQALASATHLGSTPSGVGVRITETFEVTDVVFGPRTADLGPAEAGHDLALALERARRKALASVTARFAIDDRYAAAVAPRSTTGDLADSDEPPPPPMECHLSDDGRVQVERRGDGSIVAVGLDLADHERPEDLTDQIRQAATRALTGGAPVAGSRWAATDQELDSVLARLTDLGRDLDRALRRQG